MPRLRRALAPLASLLLVAPFATGCHEARLLEPLPLLGATPITVTMTTAGVAEGATLPHLAISAVPGGVEVRWDVMESCGMLAQVSGERSGDVVAIYLRRQGNPVVLCAPAQVAQRYVLHAEGLGAGRYTVRFADALGDAAPREMGRLTVTVPGA